MNIEPGFTFVIPYEVIRSVVDGELAEIEGNKTRIRNEEGYKFWVKPLKTNDKPMLVCFDVLTSEQLKRCSEMGQEMAGWMK